jgi:putative ABC transport system substrate-binding protein
MELSSETWPGRRTRPGLARYWDGPDNLDQMKHAALFVDAILKGAKPADLPVRQPTNFQLAIHPVTAKALGLTAPQSLVLRADDVID